MAQLLPFAVVEAIRLEEFCEQGKQHFESSALETLFARDADTLSTNAGRFSQQAHLAAGRCTVPAGICRDPQRIDAQCVDPF
jgi:hypothetical protein